ncbi:hypothetical protein BKA61DRAFT_580986 [Leptodontidium sp. MPI-SDFR-AT-0119]|nr:hypothetical protein BKA61DRAFT_580986 [Leptodontidium sp. MPI-SDFR-AT-0119]
MQKEWTRESEVGKASATSTVLFANSKWKPNNFRHRYSEIPSQVKDNTRLDNDWCGAKVVAVVAVPMTTGSLPPSVHGTFRGGVDITWVRHVVDGKRMAVVRMLRVTRCWCLEGRVAMNLGFEVELIVGWCRFMRFSCACAASVMIWTVGTSIAMGLWIHFTAALAAIPPACGRRFAIDEMSRNWKTSTLAWLRVESEELERMSWKWKGDGVYRVPKGVRDLSPSETRYRRSVARPGRWKEVSWILPSGGLYRTALVTYGRVFESANWLLQYDMQQPYYRSVVVLSLSWAAKSLFPHPNKAIVTFARHAKAYFNAQIPETEMSMAMWKI